MPLQSLWLKTLIGLVMALVLGLVFLFHFQPDVLIALTNQVWACF
jgi:hypothetical protein